MKRILTLSCAIIALCLGAPAYSKEPCVKDGVDTCLKSIKGDAKAGDESAAQNEQSPAGYGKTRWGMTPKQVEGLFPEGVEADGPILVGTTIANQTALVSYMFDDSLRLYRAVVIFTNRYSEENKYIFQYRQIKDLLAEKYGVPVLDDKFWANDLFRDDPKRWGRAISTGQLEMFAKWEVGDTEVFLKCAGNDYKVFITINYSSRSLSKAMESKEKKRTLEGL